MRLRRVQVGTLPDKRLLGRRDRALCCPGALAAGPGLRSAARLIGSFQRTEPQPAGARPGGATSPAEQRHRQGAELRAKD